MNWISVVIIGFALLEASNVAALYFMPESKKANAMGVFKAWEQSKQDPAVHDLVRYLVNWVAGTKLMILVLLLVVLLTADAEGLFYTGIAMVIAISSFFWRLFPLARKMDREGQLDPAGYSSLLGLMIAGMLLIFLVAIVVTGNG